MSSWRIFPVAKGFGGRRGTANRKGLSVQYICILSIWDHCTGGVCTHAYMIFCIIRFQCVYPRRHLWFPQHSPKAVSIEPANVWEMNVALGTPASAIRQGDLVNTCVYSIFCMVFCCDSRGWNIWGIGGGISKWEALRFANSCMYSWLK